MYDIPKFREIYEPKDIAKGVFLDELVATTGRVYTLR